MSKTFSIKRRNKLLTKKLQDQKLQKKMNKLKLLEVINDNLFDAFDDNNQNEGNISILKTKKRIRERSRENNTMKKVKREKK